MFPVVSIFCRLVDLNFTSLLIIKKSRSRSMPMGSVATLVVIILLLALYVVGANDVSIHQAFDNLDQTSILLCAYNRSTDGFSELEYVDRLVANRTSLSHIVPFCVSAYHGFLPSGEGGGSREDSSSSVPVIVVVTGIGGILAGGCTQNLLTVMSTLSTQQPKRLIWSGTAGFSPLVNGGMTPSTSGGGVESSSSSPCLPVGSGDTLSHSSWNSRRQQPKVVPLGSLCASITAVNQDCGVICTSPDHAPKGLCNSVPTSGCTRGTLFSKHQGFDCGVALGNNSLASDFQAKIEAGINTGRYELPRSTEEIKQGSKLWWAAATSAYPFFSEGAVEQFQPVLLPEGSCTEMDTRGIWVGPDSDWNCRTWTSQFLNEISESSRFNASNVVCVSAMEGYGFLGTIKKFYRGARNVPPVVNVRAASDWTFFPPYVTNTNVWYQNETYTTPTEKKRMLNKGFEYATKTSNDAILFFLGASRG